MSKQSHTLGKTFGKAELSVDVYHPLADDVSGDLSHLFSQLIYVNISFLTLSPILPMPITIFFLSTYVLQDVQTVSNFWQNVQQS